MAPSHSQIAVLQFGRRGQFGRGAGPYGAAFFEDVVAVGELEVAARCSWYRVLDRQAPRHCPRNSELPQAVCEVVRVLLAPLPEPARLGRARPERDRFLSGPNTRGSKRSGQPFSSASRIEFGSSAAAVRPGRTMVMTGRRLRTHHNGCIDLQPVESDAACGQDAD